MSRAARLPRPRALACALLAAAASWSAHAAGDETAAAAEAEPRPLPALAQAESLLEEDRVDRAIDVLREAAERHPDDARVHAALGVALSRKLPKVGRLRKLGVSRRLRKAFERALELEPRRAGAREGMVLFHRNAPGIAGGSDEERERHERALLEHHPVRGGVFLGTLALQDGELERAEALLRDALEADPESHQARLYLGVTLVEAGRHEKGLETFDEMLKRDPQDAAALYQVGRTAVLSQRGVARGKEALTRYLELEPPPGAPSHADAHVRLGNLHELEGEPERARASYRRSLELDPDHPRATAALERLDEP